MRLVPRASPLCALVLTNLLCRECQYRGMFALINISLAAPGKLAIAKCDGAKVPCPVLLLLPVIWP